jgi:cytochrome P450
MDLASIHVSPKIWGPDVLEFRPSRWIKEDGTMYEPSAVEFLPFSTGPRSCPGMKMAQVEFVAVIQAMFSKWKVEVAQKAGETKDAARERLAEIVADSSPKLTLQVNRPQDVALRWTKR